MLVAYPVAGYTGTLVASAAYAANGAGLALAAAGVACTMGAGFLGWMLVQNCHLGVTMTEAQERDEFTVQSAHARLIGAHRGHAS